MKKQPAVYLLTNKPDGTLYTGVTSDLSRRVWQHKNSVMKGLGARYNLNRLVYFELFEDMYEAISREKQIKAG
jgi:putative endonuclease